MKTRKISILMVLILCFTIIFSNNLNVYAVENNVSHTRGVYLAEGNSSISKVSMYKINATGVTTAAKKCNVSVTVKVEKYLEDRGWVYYTSWQTSNSNAYTAAISKTLTVDLGYFYRVISTHTAGTDTSSSATNAIWMGL